MLKKRVKRQGPFSYQIVMNGRIIIIIILPQPGVIINTKELLKGYDAAL